MSQKAPEGQSSLYHAAHEVAIRLVGVRGTDLDEAITSSLALIGGHFEAPSVGLGGVSTTGELMPSLYLFGSMPSREEALNLTPPGPRMAAQLRREGSVVWSRLEDLSDLPQFQDHLGQMGVSAGVFWAHRDVGSYVEGMAMGSPVPKVWPVDVVEQLGVFGTILYNAIHRRRAEVEVERLTAELIPRRAYDEAPVGLCIFDTELRYLHINKWLAQLNGLPAEKHVGRTIHEVIPDVAARVETQLRQVMETNTPIIEGTVEAPTPAHAGTRRTFMHTYLPVVDSGRVVGASCLVQDITARRTAEIALTTIRKLEHVVADLAAQLISRPGDQVDDVIKAALGRLGESLGLGFAVILQWNDPEQSTPTVRHEWGASSIEPPYAAGSVLSEPEGWLATRLREADPLLIPHLEDLPGEAAGERERWARAGIRSVVWAPFMGAGGHRGFVGLGSVHPAPWLEALVSELGLLGSVCANAGERLRADLELREAYEQIRTLKDRLESENIVLREEIRTSFADDELVGKSHAFRTVLRQMEQVAGTDSAVLLLGETGTGKGLVARRIHEMSGRSERPMVTVNCAALPAALIESELFGHEKGAFTGAASRKIGRFELAAGGTIFLDEVGDLPLELQPKLLRVLHDGRFERLGSSTTLTVDARVIAATNRDLDLLVSENRFRADLYYRLGVFPIRIPPLRERRSDIPLLVWFFVAGLQARVGKRFETIPADVMNRLLTHDWPGNVRELQNSLERAMILASGSVLDFEGVLPFESVENDALTKGPERTGATLREVERAHILDVLEECGWRVRGKGGAAERLGLPRSTLQSRMKKLGIQQPTA